MGSFPSLTELDPTSLLSMVFTETLGDRAFLVTDSMVGMIVSCINISPQPLEEWKDVETVVEKQDQDKQQSKNSTLTQVLLPPDGTMPSQAGNSRPPITSRQSFRNLEPSPPSSALPLKSCSCSPSQEAKPDYHGISSDTLLLTREQASSSINFSATFETNDSSK